LNNNRVLSALCYFSILFAPFLLPVILYFIAKDEEVKYHAKRSLLSHLIPVGLLIICFIVMIIGAFSATSMSFEDSNSGLGFVTASTPFVLMIIYLIVSLLILIWNIVQGIKVLQKV
jgi:hypothetical protein